MPLQVFARLSHRILSIVVDVSKTARTEYSKLEDASSSREQVKGFSTVARGEREIVIRENP